MSTSTNSQAICLAYPPGRRSRWRGTAVQSLDDLRNGTEALHPALLPLIRSLVRRMIADG